MVSTVENPTFCEHCGGAEGHCTSEAARFAAKVEHGARRAAKAIQPEPGDRSPALAALLSFVIPGLGQLYNGEVLKGLLLFVSSILILPWIVAVVDAYYVARLLNFEERIAYLEQVRP